MNSISKILNISGIIASVERHGMPLKSPLACRNAKNIFFYNSGDS